MKRILRALLGLFWVAGTFSCVREELQPAEGPQWKEVVFHAGWASETRAELQEDGSVWWTSDDEIALYSWRTGNVYRLKSNCVEPSPKTDFVGLIGEDFVGLNDEGESVFYAVYPYENAKSSNRFTIPIVQYAKAGGFSPGQIVSVARSNDDNLTFYNACAGIKFSVAHEGISKIIIKNRENCYPITGDMYIPFYLSFPENPDVHPDFGDGNPDASNPDVIYHNVSNSLTVYPAEGQYFIPGEYYYASLRPGLTSFVISYYTDNQVATTTLWYRDIDRSKIAVFCEKDKNLIFENNYDYTYSGLDQDILPYGIDKSSIQEVIFHTSSDVTTDTVVPGSIPSNWNGNNWIDYIPVYFELQGTTAHYYTKADRYMMTGPTCISFKGWSELRSVDLSMFCTNQVMDFTCMFDGCLKLESVNLSSFDTSNARTLVGMFQNCKSLKSLDVSNFSSLSLAGTSNGADAIFNHCYDLTKLDLGNFDLSTCGTSHAMLWLAKFSKNCAIRCNSATRDKLSDDDSRLGSNAQYITWVLPEEELPDLEPLVDPSLYTSTDYSKDKTVRILHQATKGNGVDIVLLGDAYSDRMIADGTYDSDMELAMNAILKDEPYASFLDYINVYTVYAVSMNEIPFDSHTVFDASINHFDPENGVLSYSEREEVYKYASIAFPDKDLEDISMILIINQAEGEGDSWTDGVAGFESEGIGDDQYNHAKSIGMINRRDRSQTETFSQIVSHEFGHVFVKLSDEYILYYGEIPGWEKDYFIRSYNAAGWWANADITSDSQAIKWRHFIADDRYSGTGIGIYEGGYAYGLGAWHPTENSIMNSVNGNPGNDVFNAPSREAIYKKIHKLALGQDWQYDYEAFVEYDQKNIAAEKATRSAPMVLQPPVPAIHRKPFIKMEKSVSPDGKERIRVIMN